MLIVGNNKIIDYEDNVENIKKFLKKNNYIKANS